MKPIGLSAKITRISEARRLFEQISGHSTEVNIGEDDFNVTWESTNKVEIGSRFLNLPEDKFRQQTLLEAGYNRISSLAFPPSELEELGPYKSALSWLTTRYLEASRVKQFIRNSSDDDQTFDTNIEPVLWSDPATPEREIIKLLTVLDQRFEQHRRDQKYELPADFPETLIDEYNDAIKILDNNMDFWDSVPTSDEAASDPASLEETANNLRQSILEVLPIIERVLLRDIKDLGLRNNSTSSEELSLEELLNTEFVTSSNPDTNENLMSPSQEFLEDIVSRAGTSGAVEGQDDTLQAAIDDQFIEPDSTEYDRIVKKYSRQISTLRRRLKSIFEPSQARKKIRRGADGVTIDFETRYQERQNHIPLSSSRAWLNFTKPERPEAIVNLLMDVSGSMDGPKIKKAIDSAIILIEALEGVQGVSFNLIIFNKEVKVVYEAGQTIDKQTFVQFIESHTQTYSANETNDGLALRTAIRNFQKKGIQTVNVVLTDGKSNPSSEYNSPEFQIPTIIDENRTTADFIGVGLGSETESVDDLYPISASNVRVDELPQVLSRLIRDSMKKLSNGATKRYGQLPTKERTNTR